MGNTIWYFGVVVSYHKLRASPEYIDRRRAEPIDCVRSALLQTPTVRGNSAPSEGAIMVSQARQSTDSPTMAVNHNPAFRAFKSATSASYLYPLKGIYHFATHPQFYSLLGRRLLPLLAVSIVVLGLLFTFAYLPQVAFMALFHGYLAFFNGIFLVLGEGQIIIALLFEALLVDETLVNVFDVIDYPVLACTSLADRGQGNLD